MAERHQAGVEITPDKQQQKGHSGVVFVLDGVHHCCGEVEAQRDLGKRHPAGAFAVSLLDPGVPLALNAVFRRAHELRLNAEDGFEHRARIAHGNSDAHGQHKRHVEKGALPRLGIERALRGQIEAGNRAGGSQEQRQVDYQHLEPALVETHDHGRQQHGGEQDHERVADVGGEVKEGFGLDVRRQFRAEDARQNLFGRLHQTLGPARLLRLEGVHLHRQLRGALDLGQVEKPPAAQLGAIGEVGIFGERVVLPAARVFDGGATPDAGGAVEVEKRAAAGARAMLDDEMAVEQDRLDLGQQGVVAVQIRPARLRHGYAGIMEIGNGAAKEIGAGDEIGVEDGDELAGSGFQAFGQRAGLEACAVGAVEVADGQPERLVALDTGARNLARLVGGIVEHLDIQELARIVEA